MIKRICLLLLLLCLAATFFAQVKDEVRPLVPGQPVEREIAGGQSHTYQINLTAGQFVHVAVEQRGIDAKLTLSSPDGKPLVDSDLTGLIGLAEPLSYEAAAAGTYQLVVSANGAATQSGAYEIRLDVKGSASPQDRKRITAESLLNEVRRLKVKEGNTEPQLSEKLGQALGLARELDDRYLQGLTLNLMGNGYNGGRQYDKAIEAYEQALTLWRGEKMRTGEASLLRNIGHANRDLQRYDKAIENYEQVLAIRRELKDRGGEANVLADLANVSSSLTNYDKAIEYYEQALTINRELKNRSAEGNTLNNLGLSLGSIYRYQKGIEYLQQAQVVFRDLKDRRAEAKRALQSWFCQ